MNKFKKIICILLTSATALSFAGCGNTDQDKETVRELAETVLDALCNNLDLESVANHTEEGADTDLDFKNKDDLLNSLLSEGSLDDPLFEGQEDAFVSMYSKIIDKVLDSMSYTIKDCDVNGKSATVKFDFTVLDVDNLNFEDIDDSELNIQEYVGTLLSEGKISINSTEEEISKAIVPILLESLSDYFDKKLSEADQTTEEYEIQFVKKGGEWLISKDSNDLTEITESFKDKFSKK